MPPAATALAVDPPSTLLPGQLWIAGSPVDWDWVSGQGIEVVLDVADPGPEPGPALLARCGVTHYRKEPLVDGEELPDGDRLAELSRLLVDAVRAGRPTLVCCSFGKNRSGLVATLALRELLSCSGAEALGYVRARRHRAVNNRRFAAYVESLPPPALGPSGGGVRPSGGPPAAPTTGPAPQRQTPTARR